MYRCLTKKTLCGKSEIRLRHLAVQEQSCRANDDGCEAQPTNVRMKACHTVTKRRVHVVLRDVERSVQVNERQTVAPKETIKELS